MTFCRDLSWPWFYQVLPSVTCIIIKFATDTHLEGAVSTLETRSKSKPILKNLFQSISTIRGSTIFRKDESKTCRRGITFGDHNELQDVIVVQSTQITF